MKNLPGYIIVFCLLSSSGCSTMTSQDRTPKTTEVVDLEKYTGLWYEIARYPNQVQKNCQGTTMEYQIITPGVLQVVNTCFEDSLGGEMRQWKGKARVIEGSNNSKLRLDFQWPGNENYWILDVGQASSGSKKYYYSLVGDPTGEYLWILGRSPLFSTKTMDHVKNVIIDNGYDPEKLIFTEQTL